MNKIEEQLENMSKPNVFLVSHHRRLKVALLESAKVRYRSSNVRDWRVIMQRITPIGLTIVTVAALALSVGPYSVTQTPKAEAQEAVRKAHSRFTALTAEQRQQIEAKIRADMSETLEEARRAKDLKILSPEEFENSLAEERKNHPTPDPAEMTKPLALHYKIDNQAGKPDIVAAPEHGQAAQGERFFIQAEKVEDGEQPALSPAPFAAQPVKYLQYTNPEGMKVILGLDENDTPVMKMLRITDDGFSFDKIISGKAMFLQGK